MEFHLLGQKIVIKDQAEAELATLAIQIVNDKVAELQVGHPLLGPQQLATLALVEIAGMLVKDRSLIDEYRKQLDSKCNALMREIATITLSERPTM
jgi:cell division protein ZapA (FtsZ GTPase activity inhibitor)